MILLKRFILPALGCSAIALRALAQMPDGEPAPHDASFTYSYSAKGDLDRGGKVGSTTIDHYGFDSAFAVPISPDLRLMGGLSWTDDELGLSGNVPLPKRLEGFALDVGAVKDLAPGWSLIAMLRPGFFGDNADFSSKTLNVGGLLSVARTVSPDFSWMLGVTANQRGRYHVLPAAGLRWNFAPDWTLAVGFPRTGVIYRVSSALSLNAGLQFQGGNYYVGSARAPGLGNTYLDYRELRAGGGFEYTFSPLVSVSLGGGEAVNRRFDYYDRNYQLDGKAAPYGTAALHFRF